MSTVSSLSSDSIQINQFINQAHLQIRCCDASFLRPLGAIREKTCRLPKNLVLLARELAAFAARERGRQKLILGSVRYIQLIFHGAKIFLCQFVFRKVSKDQNDSAKIAGCFSDRRPLAV
jgi:hypothetical protein